jgi:hypothetical protein
MAAPLDAFPAVGVYTQRLHSLSCDVQERAVLFDPAVSEQPGYERQGVVRQCAVHERLLPVKRFDGAATRTIVFDRTVDELWKQLGGGTQTLRRSAITPV